MDFEPSKEEVGKVNRAVKDFLEKLKVKDAEVILGGSGAKGTWLSGTRDLDVYVKYDYGKYKDKSAELSDLLEPILKRNFSKVIRLHGSRDYFQTFFEGYKFEIIPILNIKKAKDAVNITDVSQLHVKYVKKHKKLAGDIRKLKQFCKVAGVYGAESYIQGFSGYVLELLAIHYGGFDKTIKNVAKWKDKVVIGSKKEAEKLNWAKKLSPLILVDPVQDERNAAAALSEKKYKKFVEACKEYLKKPSEEFFVEKKFNLDSVKVGKGKKLIVLDIEPKKGKEDVIGAKLRKAYDFIKEDALRKGFKIHDSGWYWNGEVFFWFVIDEKELSADFVRKGPPVKIEERGKKFSKAHKSAYKKNGFYYAKIKREIRTFEDFVKYLKKKENVMERIESIKIRK